MTATAMVPKLNVVEQAATGLLASGIPTIHTLGFEGGVEAFHHSIVIAVAPAAHTDLDAMLSQQILVIVAGILTALVGVV